MYTRAEVVIMALQLADSTESVLGNGLADAEPTRDAVRSKAWRQRQKSYLTAMIRAAGQEPQDQSVASCMEQLKLLFAAQWQETVQEAPASVMRHDPKLTRAERRRISSVKNNRLCRQRHAMFQVKVEAVLTARGVSQETLAEFKGLR